MTSRRVLEEAKAIALSRLTEQFLLAPYSDLLCGLHHVPAESVVADVEHARARVRDAVLLSRDESRERRDEILGETDGETIWIVRGLSMDETVTTLLHEAMHDSVFIRRATRSGARKGLSCELEHQVIYGVLE